MDELLKDLTEVHIIESPNKIDIEIDRKEGYALGEALRLSNVKYSIYNVIDKNSFTNAINQIIEKTRDNKKYIGAVTIHISMHGNTEGLRLTSDEIISWEMFAIELVKFKDTHSLISLPDGIHKISPIALSFSSCEGYNGYKINDFSKENESLFMHIIGPIIPVSWVDSLIAFTTFYHNTLNHNIGLIESIKRMNSAANLDNVFHFRMGKGLKAYH